MQAVMLDKSDSLLSWTALRVFILLSISYIVALRVSGEIQRIPSPALLLALVPTLYSLRLRTSTILLWVLFIGLSLLHLVLLDATGRIPFFVTDVILDYALYAGLICAYVVFFSDVTWDELERPCRVFFQLMTLIAIGLWLLARVAGTSYGVEITYTVPRLQGLMTEPSNIAHFLPGLLIYSFLQKRWRWVLICATAAVLTFSPTVYLTLTFTIVLLRLIGTRPLHVLIVIALVALAVALIVANFDTLLDALSELGQPGQALARILEGFSFILTAGGVGANSRADLIFAGVDFMNAHELWWTGAGFGTSAFIGDAFNGGLLFDSNSWFSLVMWFGVLSLPIYLGIQYLAVRKPESGFMYILLVSLCVSHTLNAGGIWLQMFFATLLCLKLKRDFGHARARRAVAAGPPAHFAAG